jgi:hypothetical protein
MGVASTSTAPGATSLSAKDRLERVQRELADQRRRLTRSTAIVGVVGAIVVIAICGYFYYGYTEISKATEPNRLLDFTEVTIDQNLPEFRRNMEQQLKDGAPQMAETLSKAIFDNIPDARKTLEEQAIQRVDDSINETSLMTEQQFRNFLQAHRAELQEKFKELAASDTLAEKSLDDVVAMLEEGQKGTMQHQADDLLTTLMSASDKVKQLRMGKKLSADAQVERRLLMIALALKRDRDQAAGAGPTEIIPSELMPKPEGEPKAVPRSKGGKKAPVTAPAGDKKAPSKAGEKPGK